MNFRYLLLAAVLGLSACNGSDTSTNKKEADSTFSDLANAKAELEKVNAQVSALQVKLRDGLSAVTMAQADHDRLVEEAAAEAIKRDAVSKELVRLAGEDGKGGAIKNATDDLLKLQGAADIAANTLKSAQDELALLKGDGKGSIFEAQEALKKLTVDKDTLTEATKTLTDRQADLLKLEGDPKTGDIGDIAKAKATLDRLIGENGKSGEVGDADSKLTKLKTDIETAKEDLKLAMQTLETLQGKDGKGGDIAAAQKKLADLGVELDTARQDFATARDEWKRLRGDDGKGGEIAVEQKKLDELIRLAGDKAEEIRKAGLELDGIKLEGETITDAATLDAARIRAQAAFDAGRFDDAGMFLTDAGLNDEAIELYKKAGKNEKAGDLLAASGKSEEAIELYKKAGKIDKAAVLLTAAGKLEDAYKLYAPEDKAITDPNPYGAATYGSVTFDKVDESPSVKHHSMQLGDKTVWFTAKAGHLVAYAQKDKNNPDAKRDPQAAVFYMSYTRDDMPKENRPVTFFFNGGPGESSIWLHLGAWAPWRLKVDQPNVPTDAKSGPPKSYPFVGNPETLLDKSDLVFVDPIGSGYSQAISSDVKKHINKDFWGVDADAKIMRDFVTRYINVNNRQSSPKYLYGESYGGGIRVPVLTKLLIDAGTTGFEEDKSDRPPVVLTGSTLHSPILDYGSNCSTGGGSSCAGYVPTYVLTSDFFGQSTERDKNRPYSEFVDRVRTFAREKHTGAITEFLKSGDAWAAYKNTAEGRAYLGEVVRLTGITATKLSEKLPDKSWTITTYTNLWEKLPNVVVGKCEPDRKQNDGYMNALKPGFSFNLYDTRMVVQGSVPYDFEYSEDDAFKAEMKKFLPKYLNYTNNAEYIASAELTNKELKNFWDWGTNREGVEKTKTSTLSDITMALNTAPKLKLIVTHGYFDAATPFFQTELDLDAKVKVNGSDIKLSDRIPVYNFEGGHMIYYVEKERPALKRAMDDFYDAPPYSPPTVASVQKSAAVQ